MELCENAKNTGIIVRKPHFSEIKTKNSSNFISKYF